MAFWENLQRSFEIWSEGLTAQDGAVLGLIGLGLMVFAVVALLVQHRFGKHTAKTHQTTQHAQPVRPVLGLRHNRPLCAEEKKSGRFSGGQKKDPFLSRLERLA